ncbi:MAG: hypothetical protein AB7G28_13620 [Pirellulales bacterium]
MRSRPVSITVIGWFLLVSGMLTLPGAFAPTDDPRVAELMARRPVPVEVQQAMLLAGAVVNFVSGYFLLRGQKWARHLYIAWSLVQFGYAWMAAPIRLAIVPGLLFFSLVVFLLFRPRANAFFAEEGFVDVVERQIPPRRALGIASYSLAGVFLATTCFAAFLDTPWIEKSVALFVLLVPVAACWAVGSLASGAGQRLRDVGILFVATAATSSFMVLSVALLVSDPEFRELMTPMNLDDYMSGIAWIGLLGAVGGLALWAGREQR